MIKFIWVVNPNLIGSVGDSERSKATPGSELCFYTHDNLKRMPISPKKVKDTYVEIHGHIGGLN